MAVENAADRAAFFNTDDFGVVAIINSAEVNGVFDNEYIDVLDVTGTQPAFTCATADLAAITPTVARGTGITINGTAYTIQNIKPDGTGITVLVLGED